MTKIRPEAIGWYFSNAAKIASTLGEKIYHISRVPAHLYSTIAE